MCMMSVLQCYNLLYMTSLFWVFVEFLEKAVPMGSYTSAAILCALNDRTINHFSIQCFTNRKNQRLVAADTLWEKKQQTFCCVQRASNAISGVFSLTGTAGAPHVETSDLNFRWALWRLSENISHFYSKFCVSMLYSGYIMDGCVLLRYALVIARRGETTTHERVDVSNTHPSRINPLNNTCCCEIQSIDKPVAVVCLNHRFYHYIIYKVRDVMIIVFKMAHRDTYRVVM